MHGPVQILDTTLRDGELTPGVRFSADAKLEIALMLATAGVHVIEAGFPGMYARDVHGLETVARELRGVTLCALARAEVRDVDLAAHALASAEHSRIHLFVVAGSAGRDPAARSALVDRVRVQVRHARSRVASVEFSPADALAMDPGLLEELLAAALAAGADVLNLSDTAGTATPEAVTECFGRVRARLDLGAEDRLSFHGHDDAGRAAANAVAAVHAGAGQVEVTVNGLGPRSGNASLQGFLDALAADPELAHTTGIERNRLAPLAACVRREAAREAAREGDESFEEES